MALFGKASPAVVEILNKLQRAEIPTNFDHNLYEYGSVRYNIQPEKVTVIYPMRFKDDSDVVLATSFFQSGWNKTFVHGNSTEIFSQQIKVGAKGENTVRNLLTFIAYVKYHVKIIRNARIGGHEDNKKDQGLKHAKKWKNFSKSTIFKGRVGRKTPYQDSVCQLKVHENM
ncbi:hypothetical protein ZIOFF_030480 [Zingiber officinale]|uniref:Uncharacterized protein n=1 Tax=Zingiber officinale TaxID=94328 RepID=A0A8J5LBQ4_ZINOF|nr:hypothetical protein ZIOFF_030480 [Zingiber officinale]